MDDVRGQRRYMSSAHVIPSAVVDNVHRPADIGALLGTVRPTETKPYVVVKYAQTLDGRIATSSGDARWITGEEERRVSHALRASCGAVVVGVGTVLRDDPRLTVRMVPGASPIRVVLDSTLRIPDGARVLADDDATMIVTTDRSAAERRDDLRRLGVSLVVVPTGPGGVDLAEALGVIREQGIRAALVEGGGGGVTSFRADNLADRLVPAIAPRLLGRRTD